MVKRWDRMKGIYLDPVEEHVFVNESYEKFLRTMYGKKFPHYFVAMLNDLLDSGIIETLDDMKKVIRYFEWKMERNNKKVQDLTSYIAALEESLQRVKDYAGALEERCERYKASREGAKVQMSEVKARGSELEASGAETDQLGRATESDLEVMIARLKGQKTEPEGKAMVEERADGEIAADETETVVEPELERPPEMEARPTPAAATGLAGGRLTESEIGVDEIEASPKIKAIENMITEVKRMEALHSDEEIERIFRSSKGRPPQS